MFNLSKEPLPLRPFCSSWKIQVFLPYQLKWPNGVPVYVNNLKEWLEYQYFIFKISSRYKVFSSSMLKYEGHYLIQYLCAWSFSCRSCHGNLTRCHLYGVLWPNHVTRHATPCQVTPAASVIACVNTDQATSLQLYSNWMNGLSI